MKFSVFRLFLTRLDYQTEFYFDQQQMPLVPTRQAYLRTNFAKEFEFTGRGNHFD